MEAWNTGGVLFNIVDELVPPQMINVLAPYAFGLGGMAVGKPVGDPKDPNADHTNLKIRVWPRAIPSAWERPHMSKQALPSPT